METLSTLLDFCEENLPDFHHKGSWIRSFDIFFVVNLNKLLNIRDTGDLRRH